MAQHDMNIANQGFPAFRSDLNDALSALVSNSSGATAPTTTFANQFWLDTSGTPNVLKQRNANNDAWIEVGEVDQTAGTFQATSVVGGVYTTGNQTIAGVKTFSSAPVVPGLNGGQLAGMRNKIINGKMEIAQRGTSFGAASLDGSYTLDRWVVGNSSAATFTVSQQLGVDKFQNCTRIVVGAPDASIAAGDQAIFQQNIEGFNAYDLIGTTFTISFWVRSSVTGTYCIALRNSGFDRSYIATYTINAVDTWEYKTITVTGGLPASGGTWNFTNGAGLRVAWALACGSTFQTTAGAWQTGNFLATANQVNVLDTIGNIFAITGVQLEVGEVATPFEHRPYGMELALCQRYYEKSYEIETAPGSSTFNGATFMQQVSSTRPMVLTPFKVTKRAAPTMTIYNPVSGSTTTFRSNDNAADYSFFLEAVAQTGFTLRPASGSPGAASWQWAASIEL